MKQPDVVILWYRSPATGVAWHPVVVGDEADQKAEQERLYRKFRGKGGVETFVRGYRELPESKNGRQP